MTASRVLVAFLSTVSLAACQNDDVVTCQKAIFQLGTPAGETGSDDDELSAYVDGDVVYFDVGYACAFPSEMDDEAIIEELSGPSSLTIENNDTGVTVSLVDADDPSDDAPNSPGEWMISHDADDKTIRFTLFNELQSGQTLHEGGDYTAVFSLGPNSAAEEIPGSSATLLIVPAP